MKALELSTEMKNKQRSLDDLVRYVRNRIEENPNYALLLGAGCSVSSGISSGYDLVKQWRGEIYRELTESDQEPCEESAKKYLKENESNWYSEFNEYSCLFEKKYDFPSQRRRFIESLVADKQPSIGYAYLVNLVKHNYFNAIFTTNFDDLINEAFYHYSEKRPMLCAHDSSVNSINISSSRPKIVKLHGDYLFEDIKSSLRETESLEDNTRNKLIEFCKDHGLIVVGYAGHDRSILDVINYLLKSDSHLSNGVYWCLRRDDVICEEVKKLLWKDKVYYVYIDGFDEFFAELNNKIIKTFPIEENLISNKTSRMVESYIENKYLISTGSEVIKGDIKRLAGQRKRNSISRFIQEHSELEKNKNVTDYDYEIFMRLEALIKNREYRKAIEFGEAEIKLKPGSSAITTIYRYIAASYKKLKDFDGASKCYDALIEMDGNNPIPFIEKSRLMKKIDDKLLVIDKAIEIDPEYYDSYDEKALVLIERYEGLELSKRKDVELEILNNLSKSVALRPDGRNPSWARVFEFVYRNDYGKEKKKDLEVFLGNLSVQGEFKKEYIHMKSKFISKYEGDKQKEEFYKRIKDHLWKVTKQGQLKFKVNILDVASRFSMKDEVSILSDDILLQMQEKDQKDAVFMLAVAQAIARDLGKFEKAIQILEEAKALEDNPDVIKFLIQCLLVRSRADEAENLLDENIDLFSDASVTDTRLAILDAMGRSGEALSLARSNVLENGKEEELASLTAYYLIKNGEISTAYTLLKEFLNGISFCRSFVSEIVNYELCKRRQSKKVDKVRLNEALQYAPGPISKAAIYELLEEREKAVEKIKEALNEDATDLFELQNWAVFENIRNDVQVSALIPH